MSRKNIILLAAVCGAIIGRYFARRAGVQGLFDSFPGNTGSPGTARTPWLAYDSALQGHWPFIAAAAAGWVLFSLYWEIAAKNAAQSKSSESSASRGVHVFLANIALLLEIAPIRGLGRFLPASSFIMTAGIGIETAGFFLAIWARRHLGRNWSGAISIKVEHDLVRSGSYRVLRHPIYTGLLTMYAGTAIVTGEWLALIGLFQAVFAYWRKIRLEEAALDVAFGPDYATYCRETWALAPGLF